MLVTGWLQLHAQIPDGLFGADTEPTEWSTFNVVLLIVLPLLLIIYYLWNRKHKNKK
jgi:hypothetical protein